MYIKHAFSIIIAKLYLKDYLQHYVLFGVYYKVMVTGIYLLLCIFLLKKKRICVARKVGIYKRFFMFIRTTLKWL